MADWIEGEGIVDIFSDYFDLFEGDSFNFFLSAFWFFLLSEFDSGLLSDPYLLLMLLSYLLQFSLQISDCFAFLLLDGSVAAFELL